MVNVKRYETIEIEGTSKDEVQELIDSYLKQGYVLEQEIALSDDENEEYPYFAYVAINQFDEPMFGH